LISFTNDGHLISKLPIAGTWVGEYETSAIISNKNSFKIKKVKFHWDNSNSELYTATVELSSYIIDDKGKFILKETRN